MERNTAILAATCAALVIIMVAMAFTFETNITIYANGYSTTEKMPQWTRYDKPGTSA